MPGNQMGQMIQMISALAEMQDRRKRMALDEHQMEVQQQQFSQQLGFQEKSEQAKNASKLIDLATKGGTEGVTALYQLGKSMGLSEDQAQQISHVGMDAGAALQGIQAQRGQVDTQQAQFNLGQQQQGLASMGSANPTAQQSAQQAAYLAQQAGGPGAMGQMMTGQLIAQMAQNGAGQITPGSPNYSADMAHRVGQAYTEQLAARQTPDDFAQGQAFVDAGMGPAAASIKSGITSSAGQQLQFQASQADILGRIAESRAKSADSITGEVSALSAMHQIAKDLADKKYADKNTAATMVKQYNAFAALLAGQGVQMPGLTSESDAPSAVGRLEMWLRGLGGSSAPVSQSIPGAGGGRQAGGNPPGRY